MLLSYCIYVHVDALPLHKNSERKGGCRQGEGGVYSKYVHEIMISIEQLFIKKKKVKKLLFRGQKDRLVKSFQRTSENQVSPCSLLLNLFRSFLIYFHISNDKLFILDTSGDVIKYTCINKKSF